LLRRKNPALHYLICPSQTSASYKGNPAMLKIKADGERKWWSIGQRRKDLKEKEKEKGKGKENKMSQILNICLLHCLFSSI
jgi:hypothetical protein